MKKVLLISIFSLVAVFSAILVKPQEIKASCYYTDDSNYGSCVAWSGARRCQDINGAYFACCNQSNDVCPAAQTQPGQTPTLPDPQVDPNCGGTSQPCCSGNTCDNSSLRCVGASQAGLRCLSQAQIDLLPGGDGSVACDTNLWCDCGTNGTGTKLKTAIGCIPVLSSKEAFLSFVLKWAVGIGGGIAFLLIIYAGFMIMTSAGNPERLKAGQELLTSAISGLILLIFSVVILKIIGVDILELNQFGFNQ
ncbi:MAG: pilin [Candidatus Woesebacteria bacterium]|nr:pilin [Candidatus Woesebacteria bacterium]